MSSNDSENKASDVPFPEAIKICQKLIPILDTPMEYDIYLDNSEKHWYLMIKCAVKGKTFPAVTHEIASKKLFGGRMIPITTIVESDSKIFAFLNAGDDGDDAGDTNVADAPEVSGVAEMNVFLGGPNNYLIRKFVQILRGENPHKVGTVEKTLNELCATAEEIRLEGKYNIFTNNCQDFCNKVLRKLGLPPEPSTFKPQLQIKEGLSVATAEFEATPTELDVEEFDDFFKLVTDTK